MQDAKNGAVGTRGAKTVPETVAAMAIFRSGGIADP